jgi:hypothetical protein
MFTLAIMVWACNSWAAPYRHPATGLVFPDQLAGLNGVGITEFDEGHPGSDVGIGYNGRNIVLTIYLYYPSAPSFDTPDFKKHFDACVEEIMKGRFKGEKTAEGTVFLKSVRGSLPVQFASFAGVDKNLGEFVTSIYLTVYKGLFLKIRYTYGKSVQADGEATIKRVVDALSTMVE